MVYLTGYPYINAAEQSAARAAALAVFAAAGCCPRAAYAAYLDGSPLGDVWADAEHAAVTAATIGWLRAPETMYLEV
jgi:hypothetical protein